MGLFLSFCLLAFPATAYVTSQTTNILLQTTEFQVTSNTNGHSTPIIGHDTNGDYIVYTDYPVVNGLDGNADIYYQRLANGSPTGTPVVVADSSENQWLDDACGDYIVYTLAPGVGMPGDIVLFQISTGMGANLTSTGDCLSPRIYGDFVIWLEELPSGIQVLLYQISSGLPVTTTLMAGPVPRVNDAAVGDRFIAWSEMVSNHLAVAAYDMQQGVSFMVASNPQFDQSDVSTDGPWIAWEVASNSGPGGIAILATNIATGQMCAVASNGAYNQRPCISGNLLSYESNVSGNYQIYIYRLDTGATFQATHSTYDEHLNNLSSNLVTYVDDRNGNDEVYVSTLAFVSVTSPQLHVLDAGPASFQFAFTNTPGVWFSVLTTTNLTLPLSHWTVLGEATEISPGQYQFTDSQVTNSPQRFYRVKAGQ
jgi:hypothetical protein